MARRQQAAEPRRRRLRIGPRIHRPAPRLVQDADAIWTRGAACPPSPGQWTAVAILVGGLLAGSLLATEFVLAALHPLLFGLFALAASTRLVAALVPRRLTDAPRLSDADLPAYTIVAPLYREAEIAPGLVAALEALDYPRHRLQALIVLEADDHETLAALTALPLPGFVELLIAPPGRPRTKPRACNVALEFATGELLTIYDAEDRPHPGQLREAAARFAAGSPRLACLQAPLRVDPDRRFLPAQFALEYAVQFDVVLPMLARLGAPFPLGGTSNHFKVSALKALGGWDAWNVTEDADLGFRLAAEGYRLGVLGSPTHEPAPDSLSIWLPQRSRWVKGYMQTFGVQTRSPPHWRTGVMAAFALTLGVSIVSALLHGPFLAWALVSLALAATGGGSWLSPADIGLLAFGWLGAALAASVGMRRAGAALRPTDLLLMPLYWPLQSLAAAHAAYQLIRCPHRWDKTPHAARTGQAVA